MCLFITSMMIGQKWCLVDIEQNVWYLFVTWRNELNNKRGWLVCFEWDLRWATILTEKMEQSELEGVSVLIWEKGRLILVICMGWATVSSKRGTLWSRRPDDRGNGNKSKLQQLAFHLGSRDSLQLKGNSAATTYSWPIWTWLLGDVACSTSLAKPYMRVSTDGVIKRSLAATH